MLTSNSHYIKVIYNTSGQWSVWSKNKKTTMSQVWNISNHKLNCSAWDQRVDCFIRSGFSGGSKAVLLEITVLTASADQVSAAGAKRRSRSATTWVNLSRADGLHHAWGDSSTARSNSSSSPSTSSVAGISRFIMGRWCTSRHQLAASRHNDLFITLSLNVIWPLLISRSTLSLRQWVIRVDLRFFERGSLWKSPTPATVVGVLVYRGQARSSRG